MIQKKGSSYLTTLIALVVTTIFNNTAVAYEFDKVAPESVGYSSAKLVGADTTLKKLYADGRIPNYVLNLYKDGKLFYTASEGRTNLSDGQKVDGDTIYHLASMSKPMVASAGFRLIDQGKINLDDKLSKYFPEFANMMVAPEGNFKNQFEPAKREITVLDLMTHTSGFTYPQFLAGFNDVSRTYEEAGVFSTGNGKTLDENMLLLSEVPLKAHPGEQFNYSVSLDVLGALIERVTGQSLADYLDSSIFTPLEMKDTFFILEPTKVEKTSTVYGVGFNGMGLDGKPIKLLGKQSDAPDAIDWKIGTVIPAAGLTRAPSWFSGGGGLIGSANDYARYLSMIAYDGTIDGKQVLTKESANKQIESLVDLDFEMMRESFGDAYDFITFGGGFGIKREPDNREVTDYIFWGGLFNTFFWFDPKDNTIGVFLTSHMPAVYNLSDDIEQIVDDARL
jgi:CubicO group peptidase (beta-lactamase class C family)